MNQTGKSKSDSHESKLNQVYDVDRGAWKVTVPQLKVARKGLSGCELGGKIFVIAGFNSRGFLCDKIEIFDAKKAIENSKDNEQQIFPLAFDYPFWYASSII